MQGGHRPGAGRKVSTNPLQPHCIRFTSAEWATIQTAAAQLNITPSEYIRATALQNKEE